jgi:hypothetical protein
VTFTVYIIACGIDLALTPGWIINEARAIAISICIMAGRTAFAFNSWIWLGWPWRHEWCIIYIDYDLVAVGIAGDKHTPMSSHHIGIVPDVVIARQNVAKVIDPNESKWIDFIHCHWRFRWHIK